VTSTWRWSTTGRRASWPGPAGTPCCGRGPRSVPICGWTRSFPIRRGCAGSRRRSPRSRPAKLRLRASVLGRLAVVGGADLDVVDRAHGWAAEAVEVARRTGDPVLVAQALINRTMSPASRDELDARLVAADAVVRLADRAGRSDLAVYGHQRRFCHHLNHGDIGAANHALERAELLAGLLPSRVGGSARWSSARPCSP
jgi:hypothetical protein